MNNLINNKILWQRYNTTILLDKNSIQVFKISINIYEKITNQYLEVLSDEERIRADRFKQDDDKKRYIVGKFFLRIILSKFVSIKPLAIQFLHTENGKPYIPEIQFNLSHSGNLILIAISPLPVGIDVEFINNDFEFRSILRECFTHLELSCINNIRDFYTFWTRKESIIKATGEGLIDDLHTVDCSTSTVFRGNLKLKLTSNNIDNNHIMSLATIGSELLGFNYWSFEM